MATLAIIHTTTATVDSLKTLAAEFVPGVKIINFVDDSILPQLARNGGALAEVEERVVAYARFAQAAGADAIKVYEYLAMDLAVVVSGVYPPVGADQLVLRAEGPVEFVTKVEQAVGNRRGTREDRKRFVESNTWSERTHRLLGILESGGPRAGIKRALFNST